MSSPSSFGLDSAARRRKYLTATERQAFLHAAKDAAFEALSFCHMLIAGRIALNDGLIVFDNLKKRRSNVLRAVPAPGPPLGVSIRCFPAAIAHSLCVSRISTSISFSNWEKIVTEKKHRKRGRIPGPDFGRTTELSFTHLQDFAAVATNKSFSRAATALGSNQSSVSRSIMHLEETIGVRLFDRIGRTVTLTANGDRLLKLARDVIAAQYALAQGAQELSSGRKGVIRIGATIQTIQSRLSPLVSSFRARFPDVDVFFVEDTTEVLVRKLEDGDLDLAIGWAPADSPIKGLRLFTLWAQAVIPKSHPLSDRQSIDVDSLAGERLLIMRRGYMTREMFEGICQLRGIRTIPILESHNPHALVAMSNDGHGIAIVPSTVGAMPPDVRVAELTEGGRRLAHDMMILWDSRRHQSDLCHAFVEHAMAAPDRLDFV
ncbi:LysR family transcriptional regulator [Fodinicurvata sp. EGI_FJ10296]|uniref:LysR family transcriptional regulator n=1 Tax=Fodinicurvata sp. EGI_FJ10296 TaxID=3231908 RepID=UPI0034525B74